MGAKDTVMMERGVEYDANCGQTICCDILPKYMSDPESKCYMEISTVIEEFVESEREVQSDISFKAGVYAGRKEVIEWVKINYNYYYGDILPITDIGWQEKLKEWGIE